jgi:mannose-6-phosphate isomerase-like protein (cupin superfamily)
MQTINSGAGNRPAQQEGFLGGKVLKRTLPLISAPPSPDAPRLKRLALPQGELAHFYDGPDGIQYLAFLDLRAGAVRGNHYHHHKHEFFYLISGEVDLVVQDLQSNEKASLTLHAGDLTVIPTGIAHAIQTRQAGHAIEFSPARFDAADVHRFPLIERAEC